MSRDVAATGRLRNTNRLGLHHHHAVFEETNSLVNDFLYAYHTILADQKSWIGLFKRGSSNQATSYMYLLCVDSARLLMSWSPMTACLEWSVPFWECLERGNHNRCFPPAHPCKVWPAKCINQAYEAALGKFCTAFTRACCELPDTSERKRCEGCLHEITANDITNPTNTPFERNVTAATSGLISWNRQA